MRDADRFALSSLALADTDIERDMAGGTADLAFLLETGDLADGDLCRRRLAAGSSVSARGTATASELLLERSRFSAFATGALSGAGPPSCASFLL